MARRFGGRLGRLDARLVRPARPRSVLAAWLGPAWLGPARPRPGRSRPSRPGLRSGPFRPRPVQPGSSGLAPAALALPAARLARAGHGRSPGFNGTAA